MTEEETGVDLKTNSKLFFFNFIPKTYYE